MCVCVFVLQGIVVVLLLLLLVVVVVAVAVVLLFCKELKGASNEK